MNCLNPVIFFFFNPKIKTDAGCRTVVRQTSGLAQTHHCHPDLTTGRWRITPQLLTLFAAEDNKPCLVVLLRCKELMWSVECSVRCWSVLCQDRKCLVSVSQCYALGRKPYLTCSQKEQVDNFVRFAQQCADIYQHLLCSRLCSTQNQMLHASLHQLNFSVSDSSQHFTLVFLIWNPHFNANLLPPLPLGFRCSQDWKTAHRRSR